MKLFPEYMGMSYEQASREGAKLIDRAKVSGHWFDLPERLVFLRSIMQIQACVPDSPIQPNG